MAYPDTYDSCSVVAPIDGGDIVDYDRIKAMITGAVCNTPDIEVVTCDGTCDADTVEGFPGVGACDGDGTRLVVYL